VGQFLCSPPLDYFFQCVPLSTLKADKFSCLIPFFFLHFPPPPPFLDIFFCIRLFLRFSICLPLSTHHLKGPAFFFWDPPFYFLRPYYRRHFFTLRGQGPSPPFSSWTNLPHNHPSALFPRISFFCPWSLIFVILPLSKIVPTSNPRSKHPDITGQNFASLPSFFFLSSSSPFFPRRPSLPPQRLFPPHPPISFRCFLVPTLLFCTLFS